MYQCIRPHIVSRWRPIEWPVNTGIYYIWVWYEFPWDQRKIQGLLHEYSRPTCAIEKYLTVDFQSFSNGLIFFKAYFLGIYLLRKLPIVLWPSTDNAVSGSQTLSIYLIQHSNGWPQGRLGSVLPSFTQAYVWSMQTKLSYIRIELLTWIAYSFQGMLADVTVCSDV